MRIDAHQHFWRYNDRDYGWIRKDQLVLKQDRLPSDLLPVLEASGLHGSVAVQARQMIDETDWLLDLAHQNPFIQGVVGWLDLSSPNASAQLERYGSRRPMVGVRHLLHDEPDARFMLRDGFVRGISLLANYDLTYDLLIFPKHLPVACELVSRFPDQPFVVDHIAKPPIKQGVLEPWATDIAKLAAFPNVCCKLSGMVTEANLTSWQPSDFAPYLDTVFEAFGTQRLMFGSDWPVCTLAGEYAQVVGVVMDYVSHLSENEIEAVLGGTATQFYGLE